MTKVILGIDPGTRITGYGLIRTGKTFIPLDFGCIRPPASASNSKRYLIIFDAIETLIATYSPDVLVVESQFVQKNVQSALKLGMAKGMAILAAERRGIPIEEIAPTRAKKAVVGNGSASKEQVQRMIQSLLNLSELPQPEDAADALALALCYAHTLRGHNV